MASVLDGLVVEVAGGLVGSLTGMMLGDHGADAVKGKDLGPTPTFGTVLLELGHGDDEITALRATGVVAW